MNEANMFIIIGIFVIGSAILGIIAILYNRRATSEDREYRNSAEECKREIGNCTEELSECNRTITEARKTLRELTDEIRKNQKISSDIK